MTSKRTARIERITQETQIQLTLNLDGEGIAKLDTPVPFLNHMLDQICRHGLVDIDLTAKGDVDIDDHHTVEDIGICLGQALAEAIGDKTGITRYGHAYVPLDEALSRVVIDFSGRPCLVYKADMTRSNIGRFDTQLVQEFFQGLTNHARISLHVDSIRGDNAHHIVETMFKAFGRALRMAMQYDARMQGQLPSTKGAL